MLRHVIRFTLDGHVADFTPERVARLTAAVETAADCQLPSCQVSVRLSASTATRRRRLVGAGAADTTLAAAIVDVFGEAVAPNATAEEAYESEAATAAAAAAVRARLTFLSQLEPASLSARLDEQVVSITHGVSISSLVAQRIVAPPPPPTPPAPTAPASGATLASSLATPAAGPKSGTIAAVSAGGGALLIFVACAWWLRRRSRRKWHARLERTRRESRLAAEAIEANAEARASTLSAELVRARREAEALRVAAEGAEPRRRLEIMRRKPRLAPSFEAQPPAEARPGGFWFGGAARREALAAKQRQRDEIAEMRQSQSAAEREAPGRERTRSCEPSTPPGAASAALARAREGAALARADPALARAEAKLREAMGRGDVQVLRAAIISTSADAAGSPVLAEAKAMRDALKKGDAGRPLPPAQGLPAPAQLQDTAPPASAPGFAPASLSAGGAGDAAEGVSPEGRRASSKEARAMLTKVVLSPAEESRAKLTALLRGDGTGAPSAQRGAPNGAASGDAGAAPRNSSSGMPRLPMPMDLPAPHGRYAQRRLETQAGGGFGAPADAASQNQIEGDHRHHGNDHLTTVPKAR